MIEVLRKKNPTLPLYEVTDEAFSAYGRVLSGYDLAPALAAAEALPYPEEGSAYLPSVPAFEALAITSRIRDEVFGTLPTQMGYCYGKNSAMNATEWHASSELNVALTPLVLLLAKRTDMKDGALPSSAMTAFFVPAGTVLEIYATTLHFCPCQVQEKGFGCMVGLPLGTNVPLDEETDAPLLFRKNKWLVCHEKNDALIAKGVSVGIYGENIQVKY